MAITSLSDLTPDQLSGKEKINDDLDLRGLTTLPEGVSLTAGGSLYLSGLTTLPEGVSLTAGGSLCLSGLTTLPEGVSLTAGGYLDLRGLTGKRPKVKRPPVPLCWNGHIWADNILARVISQRGNVWRVTIVGQSTPSYLVTDGKHFAHGKTLKDAKADLVYKVTDRKPEQYKGLNLNSALDFAEAVACYRCVTGACAMGVKHFVDSTGQRTEKVKVKDIIKMTVGQFGHERFKAFFQP
jgi:hypothetical protein